jgi:glycyl-tRNA synthetase beta chain
MQDTLLVELLTEELPPKSLGHLADSFASGILNGLMRAQLKDRDPGGTLVFATPRRLAVAIPNVLAKAANRVEPRKLMPAKVAFDADGRPSTALAKRLEKERVPAETAAGLIERRVEDGTEYVYVNLTIPGRTLAAGLQLALTETIAKLPMPKVMSYQLADGETTEHFVRPVHRLVALHGGKVVEVSVLGLAAGNRTLGHRFMGEGEITIARPDEYADILETRGSVIASFQRRMDMIREALADAAGDAVLADSTELLSEVTALVEYPVVYEGRFSEEFLAVPQECLILSMERHQKYFPLLDPGTGKLLPRFLIVSNLKCADPKNIVQGNERVLRARLSDAKFFFDHDRKTRLADRVAHLAQVVYHNRLGSQLERVQRIQKLAGLIAKKLGADAALAERAGWLCKADLITDMVGEFPELQGIMGQYYAMHDGEPPAVARAVEAHYHPRFAGDALPEDNIGAAVALADKLDTLVGIYGIGGAPTGDKDPFALRRHALGVLRILSEKALPLDVLQILQTARSHFPAEAVADSVAIDVHQFMLERLRNYLRERGFQPDEIDAVVSQNPTRIDLVLPRLEAVREFKKLPEAASLAIANKRIQNILKKTAVPEAAPDVALMQQEAERALFAATANLSPVVASLIDNGDYTEALRALARARQEVDTFFEEVMVMTEEPLVRANRLSLLKQLGDLMNRVADISRLAG